jgi:hypothetical protein
MQTDLHIAFFYAKSTMFISDGWWDFSMEKKNVIHLCIWFCYEVLKMIAL